MISIYIDCNILLDWLLKREPFSYYAARLIELTEEKKVESYVSALTLANTYYIISKTLNKKVADEFLKDCLRLFIFTDITGNNVIDAIKNKNKDFEDDLHYFSAINSKIEYLITRNQKDFLEEKIKIRDAEEFIKERFEDLNL